jgi:peptide deformylase
MSKILKRTEFGNPILQQRTRKLSKQEILSAETQELIVGMFDLLEKKKFGVALAAPQVGQGIALSVINIKPTKIRPNLPKKQWAKMVIINPEIIETCGRRDQLWEGCISFANVFAKVPRYKKIKIKYLDEKAVAHEDILDGLLAHVLQHETDHLNGILFVQKVKDTTSFMTATEYTKRIVKPRKYKKL